MPTRGVGFRRAQRHPRWRDERRRGDARDVGRGAALLHRPKSTTERRRGAGAHRDAQTGGDARAHDTLRRRLRQRPPWRSNGGRPPWASRSPRRTHPDNLARRRRSSGSFGKYDVGALTRLKPDHARGVGGGNLVLARASSCSRARLVDMAEQRPSSHRVRARNRRARRRESPADRRRRDRSAAAPSKCSARTAGDCRGFTRRRQAELGGAAHGRRPSMIPHRVTMRRRARPPPATSRLFREHGASDPVERERRARCDDAS